MVTLPFDNQISLVLSPSSCNECTTLPPPLMIVNATIIPLRAVKTGRAAMGKF
jgi:hypothetical protein